MDIRCPLCHETAPVRQEDASLSIYFCSACQHPFSAIPESEQDKYEPAYFEKTHKRWFSHPDLALFRAILASAKRFLPNQTIRLMDVGCGNGNLLKFLAAQDPSADPSGIDLVPNHDTRIHFYQGDFFHTALPSNFNVVTGLAVIEHVNDPRTFIRKTYDLLAPEGLLILMTVNSGGFLYGTARLLKKLGIRTGYDRLFSKHHLQHFTNASLKKAVELEGFDVLSTRNHNFPFLAVDVPQGGWLKETILRTFIYCAFIVSKPFQAGMLQTVVCRKRTNRIPTQG